MLLSPKKTNSVFSRPCLRRTVLNMLSVSRSPLHLLLHLCVIIVVISSTVSAEDIERINGVITLDSDNYYQQIEQNRAIAIMYGRDIDDITKVFIPRFEEAATQLLQDKEIEIEFGYVDLLEDRMLQEKLEIKEWPLIWLYVDGVKFEYLGIGLLGQHSKDMARWIKRKAMEPSVPITCEKLQKKPLFKDHEFTIVYFGPVDNKLYTDAHVPYGQFDNSINNTFYHTDISCQKNFNIESDDPKIVLFRNFENYILTYNGTAEMESLKEFVQASMIPTLFEFNDYYIDSIFRQNRSTVILYREPKDKFSKFAKTYAEAAQKYKGKILFTYSSLGDNRLQEMHSDFMNVTENDLPCIMIIEPYHMRKYKYPKKTKQLTVEKLGKWLDLWFEGKVKPFIMSELPVNNTGKQLQYIIGDTYDEITQDPNKDVFVFHYFRNKHIGMCPPCAEYLPGFKELAKYFKDNENMVFGYVDIHQNFIESYDYFHLRLPRLKFFPKNNKEGIYYEGIRQFEYMLEWLEEYSPVLNPSAPVLKPDRPLEDGWLSRRSEEDL